MLGLGPQSDRRPVRRDTIVATGKPLDAEAVANYIAKYATKTLTVPGVPDTRIRHAAEITSLRCSAHYRAMITTAWDFGEQQATGDARFRQWAHMLGYGGHFLTKSRCTRSPSASSALRVTTTAAPSATSAANATPGDGHSLRVLS
jgi:hypothetical protein